MYVWRADSGGALPAVVIQASSCAHRLRRFEGYGHRPKWLLGQGIRAGWASRGPGDEPAKYSRFADCSKPITANESCEETPIDSAWQALAGATPVRGEDGMLVQQALIRRANGRVPYGWT